MKFAYRACPIVTVSCITLAVLVCGCSPHGGSTVDSTARPLPAEENLASLPLGDLAGASAVHAAQEIPNPLAGDATAVADGTKLFVSMNCAGCHGYDAGGGMGPNLTDTFWRYGGTPSSVYKSIYEGRPQGMPAWGRALPPTEIWKIVAYIQTLGGTVAAKSYHAGLQGDHSITSEAPEVHSLSDAFDRPKAAPQLMQGDGDTDDTPHPPLGTPRTP